MSTSHIPSVDEIIQAANAANAGTAPGIVYSGLFTPNHLTAHHNAAGYGGKPVARKPVAGDPYAQPKAPRSGTMERYVRGTMIPVGIHKPTDPGISGRNLSNLRTIKSVRGNDDLNFRTAS